MRRLLLAALLFAPGLAHARPVEAIEADRVAATSELRDLDRRASALDEQIGLRQRMLRRRLRALYKIAQRGGLALVVDTSDPAELATRLAAAERIVGRDLRELAALDEEMSELSRDRTRRGEELSRSVALEQERAAAASEPPVGMERLRGKLPRPVPGAIVQGLSRVRVAPATSVAPAIELPRRSVELAAVPGEPVRAVAPGEVRWIGELEGLGQTVVIDHGDRYVTLTARLSAPTVEVGARVAAGDPLGAAAGSSVAFQLTEGRTALDPGPWMLAPGTRPR